MTLKFNRVRAIVNKHFLWWFLIYRGSRKKLCDDAENNTIVATADSGAFYARQQELL